MAKKAQYHAGKMGAIVQLAVNLIKQNPELLDDVDYLKVCMVASAPELGKRDECVNCGASMTEYLYSFDAWDAILLLRMATAVRDRVRAGLEFTEANQVRVPDLQTSHTVRCRTTQASKLGLIAQLRVGGRRVAGTWVITRRGWEALAGKPVPKKVRLWRGKIEERYEETTTIMQALRSRAESTRGGKFADAFRKEAEAYDPGKWYETAVREGGSL